MTSKEKSKGLDNYSDEEEDYKYSKGLQGGQKNPQDFQKEIDELHKRLRYTELEQKKREIELNAELANERQRGDELQQIMNTKLAGLKENREVNELQERLICVENDLFEKQQIAHEMLQQLTQMEAENERLQEEILQTQNNAAASHSKINEDGSQEERLLSRCVELEQENRDLQIEVNSIRFGAIDAIVEKDRIIYDLQENVDNARASLREAQEQQTSSLKGSDVTTALEDQIDELRQEQEERLRVFEHQYEQLQSRFDQDALQHEEQLLQVEQSISSRVFESLQQHLDSAKSTEAELLAQLQLLEERAKSAEKLLTDSQKLLSSTKEDGRRERESTEIKVQRLHKQCEAFEEVSKALKITSKELDELKKSSEKEALEKQNSIDKLSQKREDMMKLQANLEAENRRLKENLLLTKAAMHESEKREEMLKDQLEEVERNAQKLTEKFDAEKVNHQEELRLAYKARVTAIAEPTPLARESSPIQRSSSIGGSNNSEHLQTDITQLGLDFNDEDFDCDFDTDPNQQQEEEKVDECTAAVAGEGTAAPSSSSTIANTPKRTTSERSSEANNGSSISSSKGMAVDSVVVHPLNRPGSTLSNSKKQSFNEGPPISEGSLRQRVAKLECVITSYEVTIEKLQNESKQTLKQLQEARRERVLSNREAELIDELNSFKMHCNRVETQFVTQKLQLTEELHFFKEEVKILEKLHSDTREHLASLQQEKEYFQNKYNKLKSILKARRTTSLGGTSAALAALQSPQKMYYPAGESGKDETQSYEYNQSHVYHSRMLSTPSNPTVQPQQQQPQQKKKTFWIFK